MTQYMQEAGAMKQATTRTDLEWLRLPEIFSKFVDYAEKPVDENALRIIQAVTERAAALPPAAVQAWIPVSERLPERAEGRNTSDRVLCIGPNGWQMIDYCYYEHQHKDYDYGAPKEPGFEQPYTHWDPPRPPQPRCPDVFA